MPFSVVAMGHESGLVTLSGLVQPELLPDPESDGLGGYSPPPAPPRRSSPSPSAASDDDDSESTIDDGSVVQPLGALLRLSDVNICDHIVGVADLALSDGEGSSAAEEKLGAAEKPKTPRSTVSALALCMEQGLLAVAVGGDHLASGSVLTFQLVGGSGGREHGGNSQRRGSLEKQLYRTLKVPPIRHFKPFFIR